jgi:tripartite-type tricarboxylate transporter receptor subunit TctC
MQCTRRLIAAALLILLAPMPALAQNWPSKAVRLIAPFPPGGSVDQVARILAQQLTAQLGQQFIVDNRGGASGSIGTMAAAKSPPDGYTFVVVFDTHAANPSLMPNLAYDTLKDLAPVMLIGTSPMAIVTHPSTSYQSFGDVVAAARSQPGSVQYGTIGSGSLGHLAMTQIANLGKVEFTHVPYKGGGPLLQDGIAGHVPLLIGTVFLVTPQVDAKRLRPIAVTSAKRIARMPGVPTVAEQGFPGYEAVAWWALLAPAGTPQPILSKIHEELDKALKTPAVAEKLSAQGMDIVAGTPDQLQAFLKGEIDRWGKVIRDNKIKPGE